MLLNNDSNSSSSSKDTNHSLDAGNSLDSLLSHIKKSESNSTIDLRREHLEKRQKKNLIILKGNDLAFPGWKNASQPWNEYLCKKWIS